jgi:predicted DNA-binding protein
MPKPKRKRLSPGTFVRFPEPTLLRIKALAEADSRSISGTVRVIVERALATKKEPPAATGG